MVLMIDDKHSDDDDDDKNNNNYYYYDVDDDGNDCDIDKIIPMLTSKGRLMCSTRT